MHDPVVLLDWQWRFTYYNRNAERVSHFKPEHLSGPTTWELFPETVGTELEDKYRRAMLERVEEQLLLFYAPFVLWLDLRVIPIASGLAVLYRDVTADKREEETRLAFTRQLEQLLEVTTDSVVSLDRGWTMTFLNRRAKEMLAPGGKILGKNLWECFPEAATPESPFYRNYTRTMETGLATVFESYYPEPLNIWMSLETRPAPDGIVVFARDITNDRRDQEALRIKQAETERQRAEIEAVYRTGPVGSALFDPVEFRYLRLNDRQAEFFGLRPEQVVGKTLTGGSATSGSRSARRGRSRVAPSPHTCAAYPGS